MFLTSGLSTSYISIYVCDASNYIVWSGKMKLVLQVRCNMTSILVNESEPQELLSLVNFFAQVKRDVHVLYGYMEF